MDPHAPLLPGRRRSPGVLTAPPIPSPAVAARAPTAAYNLHRNIMSTTAQLRPARLPLALCAALAALPAAANPAPAGDPSTLDTVVVTATGFEQKIVDAPASISVITRDD